MQKGKPWLPQTYVSWQEAQVIRQEVEKGHLSVCVLTPYMPFLYFKPSPYTTAEFKTSFKIDKHVYMSVRSLDSHAKLPHWYCSEADNSDRRFVSSQMPLAVQISVFVSIACGLMGAEAKCRTQFDGKRDRNTAPNLRMAGRALLFWPILFNVGPYDAWSLSAMNSLPRISDSRPALQLKAKYFTPETHKASWYRMHLLVSLWP